MSQLLMKGLNVGSRTRSLSCSPSCLTIVRSRDRLMQRANCASFAELTIAELNNVFVRKCIC